MTEFDFEELDQAVNKLMEGVDTTKRNAALDDPQDKVVALEDKPTAAPKVVSADATPTPVVEADVPKTDDSEAAKQPEQSNKPSAPAVKRRGRFMDVIHPGGDVKKPMPVNRQGGTIQPLNADVKPEAPAPATDDTAPDQDDKHEEPQASSVETTPTVFDFDKEPSLNQPKQEEASAPTETAHAETTESDQDDTSTDANDPSSDESPAPEAPTDADQQTTDEEPLSSPFLPGAKPEKRPLGGAPQPAEAAAPAEPSAEGDTPELTPTGEDPNHQLVENPTPVILPEELKSDVVAVETSTTSGTHTEEPTEKTDEKPSEEAPAAEKQSTGNGSITQQYTESPNSGDQSNGSIYDTSTYHQALLPAPKKHVTKAFKVVLWVLFLMIIGAGIGSVYFWYTRG